MTTKQAKTQPAPYRRITDHTTAILIQIITQLHSTADPNQAELICHPPPAAPAAPTWCHVVSSTGSPLPNQSVTTPTASAN